MSDKNASIEALEQQSATETPGAPIVTVPKPSQFLYVQSTGAIYRPDGSWLADGYSGRAQGLDNPEMEAVISTGPIPTGIYTLGDVNDEKGPYTIRLIPASANDMHGRSGFLIHGDNKEVNHTASEGCIIMPRLARIELSSGGTLRVIERPAPAPQVA